jgi:hypothetical protein
MTTNAILFSDASHVNVQGSQFTTTQTTIFQSPAVDPLEILHRHRAMEAYHTSKTAADAPKCKPGTRIRAIKDIIRWTKVLEAVNSTAYSTGESVLWLRGPAGAGKTCIMREVARILRQEGVLAGDYFFSTRVPGLDDETPFVATIVSHLITVIPALGHPVRETIRLNPTLFEQSLELQLEELISEHLASIPPQTPRILVVDGFDECRDQKQRARLLRILHSLVTPPHSFRVVMASRPEYDIRTAFDLPPLDSITKIVHLEAYDDSREIYQYLSDEFARIRKTHPAKESISSEWPGKDTLLALTDKSSGGYIYPSVVIRYVDNPRRHPLDLLEHVLSLSPTGTSGRPFAELDALYEFVLNPSDTDIPLMKRLLHVIIEVTGLTRAVSRGLNLKVQDKLDSLTQNILSAPHLDEFLSLKGGMTEIIFCDLHSILSVTEDVKRPWIYFHHKSLEDYLLAPHRAGSLYQSKEDTHSDIVNVCLHNIELWNRKLGGPNPDLRNIDVILRYSCVVWKHLLIEETCLTPSVLDFDARSAWRCFAATGVPPPEASSLVGFVGMFHNAMVGSVDLSWQSHTHTCLVQQGRGMPADLRLVQAYP